MLKGNKPDFHDAMKGEQSQPMYEEFLKLLGSMYRPEAVKGTLIELARCRWRGYVLYICHVSI